MRWSDEKLIRWTWIYDEYYRHTHIHTDTYKHIHLHKYLTCFSSRWMLSVGWKSFNTNIRQSIKRWEKCCWWYSIWYQSHQKILLYQTIQPPIASHRCESEIKITKTIHLFIIQHYLSFGFNTGLCDKSRHASTSDAK